jgi:hypothetical protein
MDKKVLMDALEKVKPGLAGKELIEQTTSFAFIKGRVVTYNDEISISHPVEGLDITGAVAAEEMYKILGKIKQEEIDITLKGSEILIKAGKGKIGLNLQKEIILPLEEIPEMEDWYDIPKGFFNAIKLVIYSCDKNPANAIMNSIHVHQDGYLEGCDNYRLIQYRLEDKMPVSTFLLPIASAQNIRKLAPIKMGESKGWIHFKTKAGTIISCRILKDKYPDSANVLKAKGKALKLPKTIWEILDKATVFAKKNEVDWQMVTVTLDDGKIIIRSDSETGWYEEEKRIRFFEDSVKFMIAPGQLKEILEETQTCNLGKATLVFSGEKWKYVVMLAAIKKDK